MIGETPTRLTELAPGTVKLYGFAVSSPRSTRSNISVSVVSRSDLIESSSSGLNVVDELADVDALDDAVVDIVVVATVVAVVDCDVVAEVEE